MKIPLAKGKLLNELMLIEPSRDGELEYRPGMAFMRNGKRYDRVYFVETKPYKKIWGVWPEEDSGKKCISFSEVIGVQESPYRLPAKLANKMYGAGESGMGYCIFTLILKDGRKLFYSMGNAIDFPDLPPGVSPEMVIDLLPHEGRSELKDYYRKNRKNLPHSGSAEYYWCLYSLGK